MLGSTCDGSGRTRRSRGDRARCCLTSTPRKQARGGYKRKAMHLASDVVTINGMKNVARLNLQQVESGCAKKRGAGRKETGDSRQEAAQRDVPDAAQDDEGHKSKQPD